MRRLSTSLTLLAASAVVSVLMAACGEDTTATPECPDDLPLYDIRQYLEGGTVTPEIEAAREKWFEAAKTPCLTPPTAPPPPADAGAD